MNKLIVENRMDLVDYPYFIILETWKLDQQSKKPGKKTRTLNVYYNRISHNCTWSGNDPYIRRALEDVNWNLLFEENF